MLAKDFTYVPKKSFKTVGELLASRKRWCQDSYKFNNSYCLYGACEKVYGNDTLKMNTAFISIKNAIYKLYPSYRPKRGAIDICIEEFNDDAKRTHSQILRVLKEAGV